MGEDVFRGQQGRLVGVVPDLMEGDQLIGKRVRLLLPLLEVERVVQIRSRGQRTVMGQSV